MKTVKSILANSGNSVYSFAKDFNKIILSHLSNYGSTKQGLKSFFEDLQKGGCINGMIGEFVYHSDCKDFYIKHIDDLEEFREELGEAIENRLGTKHYTFVVWLCFEEYCWNIYNDNFQG